MNTRLKIIIALISICLSGRAYTQADTIVWEQKSSLPDSIQRVASGYFLLDSNFYVVGGQEGSGSISTVWKYNIPTDSWMQMKTLPFGPATSGGSFIENGKGYFLTSRDSISNNNCDTLLWMYDPTNDTWTKKAGFPDKPRQNASSFSFGNYGYVAFTEGCGVPDNHLWQYNPVTDTWAEMAPQYSVIASSRAVTTTSSATAYFLGGSTIFGSFINDFWRYNISSDSWDSIGQMPGVVRANAILWDFDSLIIGGGGSNGISLFSDFYSYNVFSNNWTPIIFQNSFDSAAAGAAFIFNKRGYYFGGASSINPIPVFNNNMWSFDASRFFPDTTTGIVQAKNQTTFSVYPNPASHESGFSISTSERGSILFYDALGRTIDERKLMHGLNQIKLSTDDEVIFYRATLQSGAIENGKIVLYP